MIKNFSIYAGFNFISLVISFLTVPILTRLIEPEQYGLLGVVASFSVFLFPIISICSETLVQVKHNECKAEEEYKYFLNSTFSLCCIVFIFTAAATTLIVKVFNFQSVLLIAPLLVFIQVLRRILNASFIVQGKGVLFGVSNILYNLLSFLLSLLFLYMIDFTATSRFIGIGLAELVIFTLLGGTFVTFVYDSSLYKGILRYGSPLILTSVPAYFLNEFGRFYLNLQGSLGELAMITVALQFATTYLHLNNSILNSVLKSTLENNDYRFVTSLKIMLFQFFILAVVIGGIYMFFDYLVGDGYREAKELTLYFVLAYFLQSLSILPSTYLNKHRRNYYRLGVVVICALTNIFSIVFYYPRLGVVAIPLSSVFCFFMYSFCLFLLIPLLESQRNARSKVR